MWLYRIVMNFVLIIFYCNMYVDRPNWFLVSYVSLDLEYIFYDLLKIRRLEIKMCRMSFIRMRDLYVREKLQWDLQDRFAYAFDWNDRVMNEILLACNEIFLWCHFMIFIPRQLSSTRLNLMMFLLLRKFFGVYYFYIVQRLLIFSIFKAIFSIASNRKYTTMTWSTFAFPSSET